MIFEFLTRSFLVCRSVGQVFVAKQDGADKIKTR